MTGNISFLSLFVCFFGNTYTVFLSIHNFKSGQNFIQNTTEWVEVII